MNIRIEKGIARGTVAAPPSKSYAHRMLICAALAEGESLVRGISGSEDMLATMDCIAALGRTCKVNGPDVKVTGKRPGESSACSGGVLNSGGSHGSEGALADLPVYPCRESGSTLRFFIPASLALTGGGIFKGTPRLIERGAGIYEEIFKPLGISITKDEENITVRGRLTSGTYTVRGDVSSQFISGLLFALPLLEGSSEIVVLPPVESRAYIDITIDAMKYFGINVSEPEKNHFIIDGGQRYAARKADVEGDWSNAAFLYAIQKLQTGRDIQNGCELQITGVNPDSIQGDKVCLEYFDWIMQGDKEAIDISGCPDLGPVLFAFAAAYGGGRFTGIRRLRIKESDRAQAMKEELAKFGICARIDGENDLEVLPGRLQIPKEAISAHNDHRIVMACAVLMTLTGGVIEGAEAVRKSYPDFFDDLRSCGIAVF